MVNEIAKGLQLIDMINQKHGCTIKLKNPQKILNVINDRKNDTNLDFIYNNLQNVLTKNKDRLGD